jgi:Tfp pilus assembly PilM family ATPase
MLFKALDLLRLAGIDTILGIDLTEHRARVVELQKRGPLFNRFRATFKPIQSFSCEFNPTAPLAERAAILKRSLAEHRITSRFAVSSIQTMGVKVVTATVPAGASKIDEWITEQRERLLKLPVSVGQIVHGFEILDQSESGSLIEVSFVRTSDVETYRGFYEQAGLTLLGLAAGSRDAFNAFLIGEEGSANKDLTLIHVGDSLVSSASFSRGKRQKTSYTRLSADQQKEPAVNSVVEATSAGPETIILGGEIPDESSVKHRVLNPFGLPSSWTLAVGLALKGFFPELSPTNFLGQSERGKADASIYRSLLHRTVLACGITLIVLLLLQLLASFYLQSRIDAMDEKLLSLGPAYTDVTVLESQIKQLENQLEGRELSFKRSATARTLHEVARLLPEGAWLYRLRQDHQTNQPITLTLYGYARSNDLVADFVKNLATAFSEAALVRSGTPLRSESLMPAARSSAHLITFQIQVKVQN